MKNNNKVQESLQVIPGVGPATEKDFHDLGIYRIEQLKNASPESLYEDLCTLRRVRIDRCQLYVFRCVVYYASHTNHDPEKLKWWNWKDHPRNSRKKTGSKPS
ncbi:MAG TPA: helix-hairpin-helix domain-containing protein [Thermoanaerobaculia bacterium]|nr:helix-hairpin-helix domain-containing protein [Thermoanaerobaculia bacterium]HUM31197.1 helix-hairpin-helix domain-containing protein [Thermoanaerobaculia bacterium]HXK69567.1 helix-hairpin-helix domain-containing protein [Thermoanaerobaculia bacterium]